MLSTVHGTEQTLITHVYYYYFTFAFIPEIYVGSCRVLATILDQRQQTFSVESWS